jgi:pilus assembly protein TadC
MEENNNGFVSFIVAHVWKLVAFLFGGIFGWAVGFFGPKVKAKISEKKKEKEIRKEAEALVRSQKEAEAKAEAEKK